MNVSNSPDMAVLIYKTRSSSSQKGKLLKKKKTLLLKIDEHALIHACVQSRKSTLAAPRTYDDSMG